MKVLDLSYHPLHCRSGKWTDLSRFHNHGTPYGRARPVMIAPGVMGYKSKDSSDYVEIANDDSLNFGTGDFSIGYWLYYFGPTDVDKITLIISEKATGPTNNPGWTSRVTTYGGNGSNYGILFSVTNGDWGTGNVEAIGMCLPEVWYFIVGTRKGNTWKIYQNGTLMREQAKTGIGANVDNTVNLIIGKPGPDLIGRGVIAGVIIGKGRAWSQDEVRENMYRSPIYRMLRGLPRSFVYVKVPFRQPSLLVYTKTWAANIDFAESSEHDGIKWTNNELQSHLRTPWQSRTWLRETDETEEWVADETASVARGYWRVNFDSGIASCGWGKLSWVATEPGSSNVKIRARTADTEASLKGATWTPYYETSPTDNEANNNRWLQLEAVLEGPASIQEITQHYGRYV